MWEWLLKDNPPVLLVGFNNSRFDNHIILHHSKICCEPDLMDRVRSRVHFTDLRTVLSQRGEQGNLESHYNSCDGPPLELHDAISDCTAICLVLNGKAVSYDELRGRAVSLESVLQKKIKAPIRC